MSRRKIMAVGWVVILAAAATLIVVLITRDDNKESSPASSVPTEGSTAVPHIDPSDQPGSTELTNVDSADVEFFEAVVAFEEAYYTSDYSVKVAAFEQVTTEQYRRDSLDKSIMDKPEYEGLTAHVVNPPEELPEVINGREDGGVWYVSTQLTIEARLNGEVVVEPYTVSNVHQTIWQQINGEWRVITEVLD